MITKETPTEEIIEMLIKINDEYNNINYNENPNQYNYIATKRRNLEDIILSRKDKNRCCGRCDGVNDLCVTDMICEKHSQTGCIICYQ